MLYTKSNAQRILGQVVKSVQQWWRVCLVLAKGCRPRFVSFKSFVGAFVAYRRQTAKSLNVSLDPIYDWRYIVSDVERGSTHVVEVIDRVVGCDCEDYRRQLSDRATFKGRACCRHAYAVLFHLGFDSLSQFERTVVAY